MSDDHECLHPDVIAGWGSLTQWARVLVPVGITIIIALTASSVMLRVDLADMRAGMAAAAERRSDNREEILRLRADLLRLERENALRHTDTQRAIQGIETKLDYISQAADRRDRRTR